MVQITAFFYFCSFMNHQNPHIVLLATAFLGPVEYFYYLNKFDQAIIEQHETWSKQTYRNRTMIVTDKGPVALTVPVTKTNGNHTKTNDITISYKEKWHIKLWRSIETAYHNSPFFLYYSDEIKEIIFSRPNSLIDLNTKLTRCICRLMDLETSISMSNGFIKTAEPEILDLRYKISPKLPPVLSEFPEYIQVFSEKQAFIPNASILDLLFCLGTESKEYLDKL